MLLKYESRAVEGMEAWKSMWMRSFFIIIFHFYDNNRKCFLIFAHVKFNCSRKR